MATTLFVMRAYEPSFFPTAKGAWNTAPAQYSYLPTVQRQDFGWGFSNASESSATNPQRAGAFFGISPPLAGTGTLTGTLDLILGAYETNAAANMYVMVHAWISIGNTDVVRGTLITNYEENTTNELPTTATGMALQGPVSLSSVGWQDGDRIVIEFGVIARNADATPYTGRLMNGTSGYDQPFVPLAVMAVSDTFGASGSSDGRAGTVTFSQTLTFNADPFYPDPPVNDECADALTLTGPTFTDSVDRLGSVDTSDTDPQPSIGDGRWGLWWDFVALPGDASVTLDAIGSDEDTIISAWTGTCGVLTEVVSDFGDVGIAFNVTSGTTYHILVQTDGGRTYEPATTATYVINATVSGSAVGLTAGTAALSYQNNTTIALYAGAASGGTAPYTYQWHRSTVNGFTPSGGTALGGATALTLNDTGFAYSTTHYYKLVVTDAVAGTATSNQVTVVVGADTSAAQHTFYLGYRIHYASHTWNAPNWNGGTYIGGIPSLLAGISGTGGQYLIVEGGFAYPPGGGERTSDHQAYITIYQGGTQVYVGEVNFASYIGAAHLFEWGFGSSTPEGTSNGWVELRVDGSQVFYEDGLLTNFGPATAFTVGPELESPPTYLDNIYFSDAGYASGFTGTDLVPVGTGMVFVDDGESGDLEDLYLDQGIYGNTGNLSYVSGIGTGGSRGIGYTGSQHTSNNITRTLDEPTTPSYPPTSAPPTDMSTPCPCPGAPGGGLDTVPNPIGTLPPWVAMCEGGCGVDSVADVAVGEVWL